jgi:hypothetical protein
MVELNSHRYQGIAGRSNVQHRTLNGKTKETEEIVQVSVKSFTTSEKKPRHGVVEYLVLGVCF